MPQSYKNIKKFPLVTQLEASLIAKERVIVACRPKEDMYWDQGLSPTCIRVVWGTLGYDSDTNN